MRYKHTLVRAKTKPYTRPQGPQMLSSSAAAAGKELQARLWPPRLHSYQTCSRIARLAAEHDFGPGRYTGASIGWSCRYQRYCHSGNGPVSRLWLNKYSQRHAPPQLSLHGSVHASQANMFCVRSAAELGVTKYRPAARRAVRKPGIPPVVCWLLCQRPAGELKVLKPAAASCSQQHCHGAREPAYGRLLQTNSAQSGAVCHEARNSQKHVVMKPGSLPGRPDPGRWALRAAALQSLAWEAQAPA